MNDDDRTPLFDGTGCDLRYTGERHYEREPAVVEELGRLAGTRLQDLPRIARAITTEAAVFALRACWRAGLTEVGWEIVVVLNERISGFVNRRLSLMPWRDNEERLDVERELAVMLQTEWTSCDGAHEFWEVRFWRCLGLRLVDAVRAVRRGTSPRDFLFGAAEDEPRVADRRGDGADVEHLAIGAAMLARMAPEMRSVYLLKHYVCLTEDEIAARIGRTSRTVRNILARARAALQEDASQGSAP
jgi:hypothetical protein